MAQTQCPARGVRHGMKESPPITPDIPISNLADYWLEVRCCGGTSFHPFQLLATRLRRGGNTPLCDALRPFRCKRCGGPPRIAAVVERADCSTQFGAGQCWRVEIGTQE